MVEFKQIIGRGSRLYPDKGKTSFEIVDYVGATSKFEDPDFDGYPRHIITEILDDDGAVLASDAVAPEAGGGQPAPPPEVQEPDPGFVATNPPDTGAFPTRRKFYVDDGDFEVVAEGRLVADTSSGRLVLTEYGTFLRDRIAALGGPGDVTSRWAHADTRHSLIEALEDQEVDLAELVEAFGLNDSDPLDALLHIAWNSPTRTRAERVRRAREAHAAELDAASLQARAVLNGLLARYEAHGVGDLESGEVFRLAPLSELGSPVELAEAVGGRDALVRQLDLVQEWLYSA